MIDRRPVSIIEYRNAQNLRRWRQKYHAQALASESQSPPPTARGGGLSGMEYDAFLADKAVRAPVRRFVGVELKESYFRQACENLKQAKRVLGDLFGVA